MHAIADYMPIDRRHALLRGARLPDRADGAALYADISGFTPAAEALVRQLGPRRGAEELLRILNQIYESLMGAVDRYGGSVVTMAGDGLLVWFDAGARGELGEAGLRAATCARAAQAAMAPFHQIRVGGAQIDLALKTSVVCGAVRRLVVGDPEVQLLDLLAGATIRRLGAIAVAAQAGEILLDAPGAELLAPHLEIAGWRAAGDERAAIVGALRDGAAERPWPHIPAGALPEAALRPWVQPMIDQLLRSGQSEFTTELRHTISLFARFAELDYDGDAGAADQLDRFVRWVQAVLARYEGWLLQVEIGDKGSCLYASFGAPLAHGDDAARAVAAALDLLALPAGLAYLGPLQIGVCGGQSRTGPVGGSTRTYSVMGDAANQAARLMEAAAPGQILLHASLAPMISRRFQVEPLPPIALRGKSEPAPVVQVARRQLEASPQLSEPHYALPLVGRGAELARLDRALAEAAEGRGQLLAISGEPGVGKSRLIGELLRRAAARGALALAGTAQPTSAQMAYAAWQPIWQTLLQVDPLAPPEAQAAALAHTMLGWEAELAERLPLVGDLLGLSLPPTALTAALSAQQRKAALEQLLSECLPLALRADGRPLLIVIEDVHWLDALSLDLLRRLGQAAATLPALLVVSHRPIEREHPLQSLGATQIGLGDLERGPAERLLRHKAAATLGGRALPQPLVEAILGRAEGNPFYIEELINYLADRQLALDTPGLLERLELPDSLAGLLLSRIDQLTPEQRTALKVASVIGRSFEVALLWGAYPSLGAPDMVRRDLQRLAQMELTLLDTPEPDLSYLFKHATIREVAYESLPYALRAQLHEQLADWIERRAADDPPLDLLAYHYGASANIAKQREYFQRAGEAALARYANAAALQYFERLAELLPPAERAPTLLTIGQIRTATSAWGEAEAAYRAALEGAAPHERGAELRAHALLGLGASVWALGRFDEGLGWMERALASFEELGDRPGQSAALLQMGRSTWARGQADATRGYVERSLAIEGPEGDPRRLGLAYHILGSIVMMADSEAPRAAALLEEALRLRRAAGDLLGTAGSSINLALIDYVRGDHARARARTAEGLSLLHQLGAQWELGVARTVDALLKSHTGRIGESLRAQREVLQLYREMRAVVLIDFVLIAIAQTALLGRLTDDPPAFALRLLAASASLHPSVGSARWPFYQNMADRIAARASADLSLERQRAAWQEGAALDWQQACDLALRPHDPARDGR